MEPDRYTVSHGYFIAGIVGLVACLAFMTFSAYIFHYLILGCRYQIPNFIIESMDFLQSSYELSERAASIWVLMFFVIPGMMSGIVAYIASYHIESQLYQQDASPDNPDTPAIKSKKNPGEGIKLILKLLLIVLLVYVSTEVFHWLISSNPPN